uniref:Uncharacterized protein n=1 Tax=Anopheles maculatus TaxID=74869 RepID=A0A182S821_9DIPT
MTMGLDFEVLHQKIEFFYMKHLNPERFALFNHDHGRCLEASATFREFRFVVSIACLAQPFNAAENVSVIMWNPSAFNIGCRLVKPISKQFEGMELYFQEKKTNKIGLMAINEDPLFIDPLSYDTFRSSDVFQVDQCSI